MNQSQLVKADDKLELAPGVWVSVADILSAPVEEVNGRGFVLHNVNRTVRVTNAKDADGRPAEIVFKLYAHRAPVNADEAEKLDATAAEKKAKQEAKKIAEAETREREIEEARRRQEHDLLRGMDYSMKAAQAQPVAAKVKEALELAAVLNGAFSAKALPSGDSQ